LGQGLIAVFLSGDYLDVVYDHSPTSSELARNPASTICVIDDDDPFRLSMMRMLAASGMHVVGYRCAAEFAMALHNDLWGCIVLDIAMPGLSGIDLMKALRSRTSAPPVIFITARDDVVTSVELMKQGAFDYIVKPARAERVIPAVHRALEIDARRRAAEDELRELRSRFANLTLIECAVLFGVARSKLNKQIAADLGLCERTIKARRARMMEKLRLATVPDLIKAAKLLEEADVRLNPSYIGTASALYRKPRSEFRT
jgi:FixJ family two-component response regulator